MKRYDNIFALIQKAKKDQKELTDQYNVSLEEKRVKEELKVIIKNILENLRSCLDYSAREIVEECIKPAKNPEVLYFPIRKTRVEFDKVRNSDYNNLQAINRKVYDLLESVQPYNKEWLGAFNKLNNQNKHNDLVEQIRTEDRRVEVKRGNGSVSWNSGVTFGNGVSVMGVPIDHRTQMPFPNRTVTTKVTIWVSFIFKDNNKNVLSFIDESIREVETITSILNKCI